MPVRNYDLIVIGSGAAGGAAAGAVRSTGRTVALIEKDKLGGDCPNYACIPTKALLRSAKVYSLLKRAKEFGLCASEIAFDWAAVTARKDQLVGQTGAAHAETGYREEGVDLFKGAASFEDNHHIRVNGNVL